MTETVWLAFVTAPITNELNEHHLAWRSSCCNYFVSQNIQNRTDELKPKYNCIHINCRTSKKVQVNPIHKIVL